MAARLDSAFFGSTRSERRPPEAPFRDELLSVERLDERARSLAGRFTVDPSRRGARSVFPRFDDNVRLLRAAYRTLAGDVQRGEFVTAAGEWLLDNYHLVASEVRDIRQHRPRVRAGRGADPPQRQPPRPRPDRALPRRLPDGRPAHPR